MALRPGRRILSTLLNPEEAIGIKSQRSTAKITKRGQWMPDTQAHASEARVEPVDRGLTLLEVVQIHPASLDTVGPQHWRGWAPVGVLDAGLVKEYSLPPTDDVAVFS